MIKMSDREKLDTHNIYVDLDHRFVSIRINPRIYRMHVIMRAADELLHDEKGEIDVIVDGDPESEIIAKFIPKARNLDDEELRRLAYRFNTKLIACSGKG